jgi:flagellar hook protein FlgE
MYAAISGLQVHQTALDVVSNNLANTDTIGYKAQRTTFVDELSQMLSAGSGPSSQLGGTNPKQVGLGVQVGSIDNLMNAGSLQSTGNPLDIAIQGDGFLRVGGGDPSAWATPSHIQYTRAGNLTVTPNTATGNGYLTTQSGDYVLGYGATATGTAPNVTYSPNTAGGPSQPIAIPNGATDVAIGQDGGLSYVDAASGQRVVAGYISLASFPNEAGMQRAGGSLWNASANSGPETTGYPTSQGFQGSQTIAGELEMSNVDLATEFTNMITAERGYQANSKVISTADEMLQTVTQMKAAP